MNLFVRIKMLCDKRGISIARLEQETGLGNGSIKKWARTYPSADRLLKVAEYFNVSTDFLLGRTENPYVNPDEGVPFEAREELETFVEFLKLKYKKV